MHFRLSLFGGNLLDIEIRTDADESDSRPFGFTGGAQCESIEVATDRRPLHERPND